MTRTASRAPKSAAGEPVDRDAKPARRSQEQRRTQTQQRLCAAALELLTEVGYERLTTLQIAQRAEVSKGAQAYHYPTKDDMLVAAYQHLLSQWETRRLAFVQAHEKAPQMEQLMHYLWNDVFGRPDFLASIEMMLAARHHPALQERLRDLLATWTTARDEVLRQVVPLDDPLELAAFLQINFCFLRGLALYNGLSRDPALHDRVLAMWIEMANGFIQQHSTHKNRKRTRP
jgi:AcrR family transcriptional regulator